MSTTNTPAAPHSDADAVNLAATLTTDAGPWADDDNRLIYHNAVLMALWAGLSPDVVKNVFGLAGRAVRRDANRHRVL